MPVKEKSTSNISIPSGIFPAPKSCSTNTKLLQTRVFWCSTTMAATKPSRRPDRKSTRLNSSHLVISYAVFCLKKHDYQHRHDDLKRSIEHYSGFFPTAGITMHNNDALNIAFPSALIPFTLSVRYVSGSSFLAA